MYPSDCAFSAGQVPGERDAANSLRQASGLTQGFDYRAGCGHYDSQSGAAISAFLADGRCARLLHVNADGTGGFSAMLVSR